MKCVGQVVISDPEMLVKVGEQLGGYVFRGHSSVTWQLESTIERAATEFNVPREHLVHREQVLFKRFYQRAEQYIDKTPVEKNLSFEWAAMMQHYSVPTRLLDVTKSYLVAAYFAVDKPLKNQNAEIWAFRNKYDENPGEEALNNIFLSENRDESVYLCETEKLNRRMIAQQGMFIVPSSLNKKLVDQISTEYETNMNSVETIDLIDNIANLSIFNIHVWRIVIPRNIHSEISRFLSRNNINSFMLFPDLDGLGKSLYEFLKAYE